MEMLKRAGAKIGYLLLTGLIIIPLFFLFDELLTLLAPNGTLFMVWNSWSNFFTVIFSTCVALILLFLLWIVFHREKSLLKRLRKYVLGVFVFLGLLLYLAVTNVVYVTPNTFVHRTPFHPAGVVYSYQDVASVNTGYGYYYQWPRRRAQLYYIVRMENDTQFVLGNALVIDEDHYEDYDKYEEIVELDAVLMQQGVSKTVTPPKSAKYDRLSEQTKKTLSDIFANS